MGFKWETARGEKEMTISISKRSIFLNKKLYGDIIKNGNRLIFGIDEKTGKCAMKIDEKGNKITKHSSGRNNGWINSSKLTKYLISKGLTYGKHKVIKDDENNAYIINH